MSDSRGNQYAPNEGHASMRENMPVKTIALLLVSIGLVHAQGKGEHWVATWGTSQTLVRPAGAATPRPAQAAAPAPSPPAKGPARRFGIPAARAGLKNQTMRMIPGPGRG